MSNAATALSALELDVDTPVRIDIIHSVTKEPLLDKERKQAYIEVLSADSDEAQALRKKLRLRRQRQRNPEKIDFDAEDVETLVLLTKGWYLVDFQGAPIDLPFSEANARALYSNHKMKWLTDQVDAGAGDRGNFFKASSSS